MDIMVTHDPYYCLKGMIPIGAPTVLMVKHYRTSNVPVENLSSLHSEPYFEPYYDGKLQQALINAENFRVDRVDA